MKNDSLVSVIVPVYNVEAYLNRCVNSIINQTYKNIEIILIDDGSTDNSGKICDMYVKKDDRVVCRHTENRGVSSARNLGLDIANGEYITFVDSDDYIDISLIEKMLNKIENQDLVVCGICQTELDSKKNYVYGTMKTYDYIKQDIIKGFFDVSSIKDYMYGPFNKLYKKSVLGDLKFRTDLRIGEDFLFVFKYLMECNTIRIFDECLYNYEKRENSAMTAAFSEKRFDYLKAVEEIENICMDNYPYVKRQVLTWGYMHRINICNQMDKNISLKQLYLNDYNNIKQYINQHKEIRKYIPLKVKCKNIVKKIINR